MSRLVLDAKHPRACIEATSPQLVSEAITNARRERAGLVPVGGGTMVAHGNLLQTKVWDSLSLSQLNGLRDYSPADTVITAQAGMTVAEAQQVLAQQGQMLPFDPPLPSHATLGGLFSANATGTLRAAFGRPRDRVLGLRAVLGTGEIVRFGGQTVKNVAGYDMVRLLAGGRGSLAIVTELTIRACAIPEADTWLAFSGRSMLKLLEAGLQLRSSPERPTAVLVHTDGNLYVRITGMAPAVALAADFCRKTASTMGCLEVEPPLTAQQLVDQSANLATSIRARVILPVGAYEDLIRITEQTGAMGFLDVGSGISELALPDSHGIEPFDRLANAGATVTWPHLPPDLKVGRDVWGRARNDVAIQARVKLALDPDGVLSPGRNAGHL